MKKKDINKITTTGFKTPKAYFDGLEDRIMDKFNDQRDIEGIEAPGYSVPKDYFDTVETRVFDSIKKSDKPVIRLNDYRKFYYIAGIAASIVLILGIYFNRIEKQTISVEMVESYFESADIDSYELAELLVEAEFLEDDFEINTTDYSEENIESYLLENADLEYYIE